MKAQIEKRENNRQAATASIVFSYFNKNYLYGAEALNYCSSGMCFKSNLVLQPGASIYIRVKKYSPNGSGPNGSRGLRSVSLAEVKWCKEISAGDAPYYGIGVKYYDPVY